MLIVEFGFISLNRWSWYDCFVSVLQMKALVEHLKRMSNYDGLPLMNPLLH